MSDVITEVKTDLDKGTSGYLYDPMQRALAAGIQQGIEDHKKNPRKRPHLNTAIKKLADTFFDRANDSIVTAILGHVAAAVAKRNSEVNQAVVAVANTQAPADPAVKIVSNIKDGGTVFKAVTGKLAEHFNAAATTDYLVAAVWKQIEAELLKKLKNAGSDIAKAILALQPGGGGGNGPAPLPDTLDGVKDLIQNKWTELTRARADVEGVIPEFPDRADSLAALLDICDQTKQWLTAKQKEIDEPATRPQTAADFQKLAGEITQRVGRVLKLIHDTLASLSH